MKSIFEEQPLREIIKRIDNLSVNNQSKWGKMNVTQMLNHCQKPVKLAFGEENVKKPNIFMRGVIKFMKPTLYNDKPWKQGLPTAKEFVIRNTEDFEVEKSKLKALVERMHKSESFFSPSKEHPIFGNMKSWMWGQSAYKHLDHHLKQFGV
ncbi:DUF1569 domain-containing protein [Flavobacteriaceae bacterium 14752]|uniref:DUF1569 domain-containing protein n=1 Tax=Mesohalobacter salilacus TaxID=2491711 RepID=UPI000F62E1CC|nr:DUF1569 domain-containing protein [Flavobacteriaceae bacterium 14752]